MNVLVKTGLPVIMLEIEGGKANKKTDIAVSAFLTVILFANFWQDRR